MNDSDPQNCFGPVGHPDCCFARRLRPPWPASPQAAADRPWRAQRPLLPAAEVRLCSFNINGFGERITHVNWNGRAAQLGLEPGDVILSMNGYPAHLPRLVERCAAASHAEWRLGAAADPRRATPATSPSAQTFVGGYGPVRRQLLRRLPNRPDTPHVYYNSNHNHHDNQLQRPRETMINVVKLGRSCSTDKTEAAVDDSADDVMTPCPREPQHEAVAFLCACAFRRKRDESCADARARHRPAPAHYRPAFAAARRGPG